MKRKNQAQQDKHITMQKDSTTPRRPRGQPFQKGFDSRRHQFTPEERSKGFWTAIAVLGLSSGQKLHESGRWPQFQGRSRASC